MFGARNDGSFHVFLNVPVLGVTGQYGVMRQTHCQSCTPAFPHTFSNAHSGQFLGGYTSDFVDTQRLVQPSAERRKHHRPRPEARNAWEISAGWLSGMTWNLPTIKNDRFFG